MPAGLACLGFGGPRAFRGDAAPTMASTSEITGWAAPALCGRSFLGGQFGRWGKIGFGDPAGLEAGLQDHLFAG